MNQTDLPNGWRLVRLADAYQFTHKPKGLQLSDFELIPFVPMEYIPIGSTVFERYIAKRPKDISSGVYFEAGDLLLAKITPSFENGKQGIIESLPLSFGIASTEVIPIQGVNGISYRDFLFYYLLRSDIRAELAGKMEGTTGRQRLSKSTLENLTIPLPPLPEQHAIAQALKAVQEAKQARQRELELERERKAALMEYLFRHGTRGEVRKQSEIGEMPESWNVVRLGDIAAVAYGLTVNQNRRGSQQQVPYLTVANVSRGALRLNDIKQIGVLHGDAQKYRLCAGDVLLVEGNGNPKLLGSAAVWHDELPFALHQNHLIRARPDQTVVVSEWLMSYLNSDRGRAQLLGRGKTSNGLHSINSRIVADLLVPVPTMREQQQVTQVLTSCDQKVITLEREIAYVDELFHAILEEIMTGRLSALPLAEQLNSQQGEAHEHQRTWRRRPFHC